MKNKINIILSAKVKNQNWQIAETEVTPYPFHTSIWPHESEYNAHIYDCCHIYILTCNPFRATNTSTI